MKQSDCPFFVLILGETGVGKTAVSELLGEQLPIEIINGDVGQLYEPLTIGTAKPAWRTSSIPHHLFDICTQPVDYSVVDYRIAVKRLLGDITARNRIPVIVGGSLFYAMSLFFPPTSGTGSDQLPEQLAQLDAVALWHHLKTIDPVRAAALSPHDTYRIQRALAIWYDHGVIPSTQKPAYQPLGQALCFYVTRDRAQLYERINERTVQMLEAGWIDEVAGLNESWHDFLLRKKLIGYPDIVPFLRSGDGDMQRLTEQIQQKTRRYAKRQGTFWRFLSRMLRATGDNQVALYEYNLTLSPVTLYINHMVLLVKERLKG
jgi:tRNA dimethylallyltransferase